MGRRGTLAPLFGRDAELAQLHAASSHAAEGAPVVVLVDGDPGVGKTALLDTFVATCDARVLRACGDPDEQHYDGGILGQLLADAGAVSTAPAADPIAGGLLLVDALERVTGAPVIVTLDDAQWADPPSLRALGFALRRLQHRPVLTIIAMRSGRDPLPAGLGRLADRTGGRLTLGGLSAAAVAELVAVRSGERPRSGTAERLRAHADGNPLHITALVDQLPFPVLASTRPLPVPRSYASLVATRLAALPEDARRLAYAASVLGVESRLADAAAVGRLDDPFPAVDMLTEARLVELVPGVLGRQLRFRHALARAAIRDGMRASERAALHRRAGAVLDGDEALRHQLSAAAGRADPALAARAAAAADEAAQRGELTVAAAFLRDAAAHAVGREQRETLLLQAAVHLLAAGRLLGDLEAVIRGFDASLRRTYVLGRAALAAGDMDTAEALLLRAWPTLERGEDPELVSPTADMLAVVAGHRRRFDEVAVWARRSLAAGNPQRIAATVLATGLTLSDGLETATRELGTVIHRAGRETSHTKADALVGRGMVRLWAGDLHGAIADLTVAVRDLDHLGGAVVAAANARTFLAEGHLRAGRTAQALEIAVAATALVDDAEQLWLAPVCHGTLAEVLAVTGSLAAAREHAAVAREAARTIGALPAVVFAEHAELVIAEADGDHLGVIARCETLVADGRDLLPEGLKPWRAAYATALSAVGRVDEARQVAAALRRLAGEAPADVRLGASAARAEAIALHAAGQVEASDAAFERGLALAGVPPFEAALLALETGAHRRRAGRRRAASTLLHEAAEGFVAIGAVGWAARAERELAACGLAPVQRTAARGKELTPQEQQVARLVGGGATNREAAESLVVSVKTVEHHLSRVYRKLGVRSRTELAARLATAPTAHGPTTTSQHPATVPSAGRRPRG